MTDLGPEIGDKVEKWVGSSAWEIIKASLFVSVYIKVLKVMNTLYTVPAPKLGSQGGRVAKVDE